MLTNFRRLFKSTKTKAITLTGAVVTGVIVALAVSGSDRARTSLFPGEPVDVAVERDPAIFDANVPVDWERYDYAVNRRPSDLPPPPSGTCRERFAWAQQLRGIDATRTKIRVYLRGKHDQPVVIDGARLVVVNRRDRPARGTHVTCPVGGAQPNPVLLYADLDTGRVRHGRVDEPPQPLLLTLRVGDLEVLEVEARTRRSDVRWRLELHVRASEKREWVPIDDGGAPFRTTAPPLRSVFWDGRRWRPTR